MDIALCSRLALLARFVFCFEEDVEIVFGRFWDASNDDAVQKPERVGRGGPFDDDDDDNDDDDVLEPICNYKTKI